MNKIGFKVNIVIKIVTNINTFASKESQEVVIDGLPFRKRELDLILPNNLSMLRSP